MSFLQSSLRPLYLIVWSCLALLFCLITFPTQPNAVSHPIFGATYTKRGLHFVIPASRIGEQSCKLLLSSAVSGYPDPVLVGWGGHGLYNGSQSNLFRVSEPLAYLRTLGKSANDDLVIIADPDATVIQLSPEFLLQRYLRVLKSSNSKLKEQGILGASGVDGVPIRNSILFAAASSCGPVDRSKGLPKCRSGGDDSLNHDPRSAYAAPRFLSSSVMIGSVRDIRALLIAVMDKIDDEFNDDFPARHSDQHYMTMLWEDQESSRQIVKERKTRTWKLDSLPERAEFGMTTDVWGEAVLLSDWYESTVRWSRPSNVLQQQTLKTATSSALQADELLSIQDSLEQNLGSPKTTDDQNDSGKVNVGFLSTTAEVFPMYIVKPQVGMRDDWWTQLWFQQQPEAILKAARLKRLNALIMAHRSGEPAVVASVERIKYGNTRPARADEFQQMRSRDKANINGGFWNGMGEYLSWDETCKPYEDQIME